MARTRPARDTLTLKQARFVEAMLANGGNKSAAYRLAYPETKTERAIRAAGSTLSRHPKVVQALAEAQAASELMVSDAVQRYAITAERVADEMARLAFTRMDQIATVRSEVDAHGRRKQVLEVRDFADIDPHGMSALVKVRRAPGGELSVELGDKLAALNSLARLKGWIADKPTTAGQLVMLKVER